MTAKSDHVLAAKQTRPHTCHWPGCNRQVPPAMWGCAPHWFALPPPLRQAIWRTYRAGQEIDMRPSEQYLKAAQAVQDWIAQRTAAGRPPAPPCKEC